MENYRTVNLTPPRLADDCIKEKITCIRAHKERLFHTALEKTPTQLIFHNYGHGGAGWTFLFGCVEESIKQFEEQVAGHPELAQQPITVIGAGCYGLLTAIVLARAGYNVQIMAQAFHNLPSEKAAGFFFPRARKCSTPEERAIFQARSLRSYEQYLAIIAGKHPFIAKGPRILPAYFGLDIDPGFQDHITHGLVAPPERVNIDFGNGNRYPAYEYQIIFMNPAVIMHELRAAVQALNIPCIQQTVTSFDDLTTSLIFNCTGLGAKELTGDKRIIPVQGHLITLKQQGAREELQYLINVKVVSQSPRGTPRDELIYYAPKDEGILGITFIRGEASETANSHEFDRLLERSRLYFGT